MAKLRNSKTLGRGGEFSHQLPSWAKQVCFLLPNEQIEWWKEFSLKDRTFYSYPLASSCSLSCLIGYLVFVCYSISVYPENQTPLLFCAFGITVFIALIVLLEVVFFIFSSHVLFFLSNYRIVQLRLQRSSVFSYFFSLGSTSCSSSTVTLCSIPLGEVTEVKLFPQWSPLSYLFRCCTSSSSSSSSSYIPTIITPLSPTHKGGETVSEEGEDVGSLSICSMGLAGKPPVWRSLQFLSTPHFPSSSRVFRLLKERTGPAHEHLSSWKLSALLSLNSSLYITPLTTHSSSFVLSPIHQRVLEEELERDNSVLEQRDSGGRARGQTTVLWKRQKTYWETWGFFLIICFLASLLLTLQVLAMTVITQAGIQSHRNVTSSSSSVSSSTSSSFASDSDSFFESSSSSFSFSFSSSSGSSSSKMTDFWFTLTLFLSVFLCLVLCGSIFSSSGKTAEVLTSSHLLFITSSLFSSGAKVDVKLGLEHLFPLSVNLNLDKGIGSIMASGGSNLLYPLQDVLVVEKIFWKAYLQHRMDTSEETPGV